ncbi:cupin domain-containing protein [Stappia stellulata]|uniref:cupin domain-containing protein n=1 Tax=Stappia stellulata TaxID=71235 RepID=UPI0004000A30|nr:cupin domain-containing protein [Stappia stellulata]
MGKKLRRRRRELGLTLKEVADGAGLSVGFISQIERGIATPSLSSLVAVSQVLQVEVANFLSQPGAGAALSRHDQRATYAISENSLSYERVSSSFPGNVLRSVIIHEPPGHRGEPIAHEGEEMIFVLKGAITVELEGELSVLGENDSIHFQSSRTHATWNHTDEPAAVLWVGTMDVFGEEPGLRALHSPAGESHEKKGET